MTIKDTLQSIIEDRKTVKKAYVSSSNFEISEEERAKRAAEWKPLPSDMINDRAIWEAEGWVLNDRMEVVKV